MSRHEYSPQIRSAMNQLSWHGRLNDAVTEEDVVAIARDYVALWGPEELGQMPADLRPVKIVDADDVSAYAWALVQAQMAGGLASDSEVHKMGAFFSSATTRLAQIMARLKEVASE
jgi:hypothetical protein